MEREITQRELRNESGEIMRAVDNGETFIAHETVTLSVNLRRFTGNDSSRHTR
jgi:hypothetical protein